MTNKVIRDGLVAVIVSPGFGAGWSTWADKAEEAVFAPDVVGWIEAGKTGDSGQFDHYGYTGGLAQAVIKWVPEGTRFCIREYDGNEHLEILVPTYGHVA